MKKSRALIALLMAFTVFITSCKDNKQSGTDSDTTTSNIQETTMTPLVTTTSPISTTETTTVSGTDSENNYLPEICSSRYGYYQLNADEKAVYDQIVDAAKNYTDEVVLKRSINKDNVKKICDLLVREEIGLYFIKGTEVSFNESTKIASRVALFYNYTSITVDMINEAVETRVKQIMSKITGGMSTVDKIKLFHDEIILNCIYSLNSEYGAIPYGALVSGEALCEGYAKAFALLCNKAGIENCFATGTATVDVVSDSGLKSTVTEAHMWNMVKVNGFWYNVDLTWDDPVSENPNKRIGPDYISYNYFLYTNNDFGVPMVIDNDIYKAPDTNSNQNSFFVHYGLYADSYIKAKEILGREIRNAISEHKKYVYIKLATPDVYNEAVSMLFGEENRELFQSDITPNEHDSPYYYWASPLLRTIQIEITYTE